MADYDIKGRKYGGCFHSVYILYVPLLNVFSLLLCFQHG